MTRNERVGVDSAKSKSVAFEQQQSELLERIRELDAEVSALVGPLSLEQQADLKRRYQELCAERDLLQELHDLLPD